MNKFLYITVMAFSLACNNAKKEKETSDSNTETTTDSKTDNNTISNLTYSVDGKEIKHSASLLVTKDKDKLQADAPFLCMLTSNAASDNNETITVNFLMNTKPGIYPIVGSSFQRGEDPNGELYGGLLGGEPIITAYKVTITSCNNLGDNGMGGHKWSISGTWEPMPIKAMPVMLMDKTRTHPAEVQLGKGTFTNLTFDDNLEEALEKGLKKLESGN